MVAERSYNLNSQLFDLKGRASDEDLESRRDSGSYDRVNFAGDVRILAPIDRRGREGSITVFATCPPCFAIARWVIRGVQMAIAVRPSPPYQYWVKASAPPLTWMAVLNHLNRKLNDVRDRKSRDRPGRPSGIGASSSGCPGRGARSSPVVTAPSEWRTARPAVLDRGIWPDSVRLECAMVAFRSCIRYRPCPPLQRFDLFDLNGAIRGTHHFAPEPPELNIPTELPPPESTHEIEGPPSVTPFRPTWCSFSTEYSPGWNPSFPPTSTHGGSPLFIRGDFRPLRTSRFLMEFADRTQPTRR